MSQALTFVILGPEADVLKAIGSTIAGSNRARLVAGGTSAAKIQAEIARHRPSAAIIVHSETPEVELELIRQLAAECPETMLIAASANASPDLILGSLRAGAQEFIRLPIIAEEIETVFDRVAEYAARQAALPRKRGQVVAVFSNKGGCGTSFLASNLAVALDAPTVLLDLNLQAGDLGFFLHLEPKFSIVNLIANRERLDDEMLEGLLTPYSPNLSLLAAPLDVDAAVDVRAEHVIETIEHLRRRFEYIVIDLGHNFDEVTLAALDEADEILLVAALEIPTIRNVQRALSVFQRLDYPPEKIRPVINRWSKNGVDLDRSQLERLLGNRQVTFIPNDYRSVIHSINLGQPLVKSKPNSPVSVEIRRLAASLAVAPEMQTVDAAAGQAKKPGKEIRSDAAEQRQKEERGGLFRKSRFLSFFRPTIVPSESH